MSTNTILVTGGTGKTGRRVAQRLQNGGHAVRIGSRSAVPSFDWADRHTWNAALNGVGAVYISYFPDVAAPGSAETIEAFVAAAAQANVRRLVMLSGRGEPEAKVCEEIVQRSGLEWTIVRASWFAQNFSESFILEPVLAGEVALPAADVGEPFIDVDDIAEVAVTALTEDGHQGQLYEVTGPRLLTFAQAVAEIARATGRDIRFVQVPIADYAAAAREAQLPPELVDLITYLFSEVLDGRNASVTDGVQRALGRPARDFADFAQATATTGIWDPNRQR
jgi:uncharacterized protein YbjT (DUF2867 family)